MNYEAIMWASFSDQLEKYAAAHGGALPGFDKEAMSLAGVGTAVKGLGSSVGKGVMSAGKSMGGMLPKMAPKVNPGWVVPGKGGLASGAMAHMAPQNFQAAKGSINSSPGIFQRFGHDLQAGGKMMQQDSTKSLLAGQHVSAGPAARMGGEMAQSVGHHYAHKGTLGNMINPLGGALGGMAEGLTRGAGKELTRGAGALGARGPAALQGTARAMGHVGSGMQRAAKGVGMAGEVAGLAGLGTAVHAPLSLAGAVGGKLIGGAAHAAPAIGEMLHGAGDVMAHGVHDVVGNAAHSAVGKANTATRRALPFMAPQPAGVA